MLGCLSAEIVFASRSKRSFSAASAANSDGSRSRGEFRRRRAGASPILRIFVTAGRDIQFGTAGTDFDNDVRASDSVTFITSLRRFEASATGGKTSPIPPAPRGATIS